MLKIKLLPVIFGIVGKLDLQPALAGIKKAYEAQTKEQDMEALKTEIGFTIIDSLLPQLGKVAGDLPKLVAAYKNISEEEAGELDAIEEIKALAGDTGILKLFQYALQVKSSGRK